MKDELVFVNGELYTGKIIFGRYKGCDWEGGRTANFFLTPEIKETAEVFLVDLTFGKLRHCRLVKNSQFIKNGQEWEAIDETEAEILARRVW